MPHSALRPDQVDTSKEHQSRTRSHGSVAQLARPHHGHREDHHATTTTATASHHLDHPGVPHHGLATTVLPAMITVEAAVMTTVADAITATIVVEEEMTIMAVVDVMVDVEDTKTTATVLHPHHHQRAVLLHGSLLSPFLQLHQQLMVGMLADMLLQATVLLRQLMVRHHHLHRWAPLRDWPLRQD